MAQNETANSSKRRPVNLNSTGTSFSPREMPLSQRGQERLNKPEMDKFNKTTNSFFRKTTGTFASSTARNVPGTATGAFTD